MFINGVVEGRNKIVSSSMFNGNRVFFFLLICCNCVILILCFFGVVNVFMIGG